MYSRIQRKNLVILSMMLVFLMIGVSVIFAGGQQETGSTTGSDGDSAARETVGTSDTRAARIEFLAGEVSVDGREAQIGMTLDGGSVVRTGNDGLADVVFGSGNALRISENTELVLDLVDPSAGLDVRKGSIAAVFEGLESLGTGKNDTFRVRTPSTVAGVRGTVFYIKIEDSENTYVCTCHGEIGFEESGLTVRAARHEATRFTRTDGEVVAIPAPELYHDSDSLNEVAAIVGVTIAWGEEP